MHHELEKFLSIVEYGSFTEAARATHVSQPALTSAIKSLESRYGSQLFFRGTKPLKLTEAGKIVFSSASRIRMETNKLSHQLKNLHDGHEIANPVGAIDSIAMRIFQYGIPAENLEVHVDNSARLVEAVLLSRIDLAFIATPLVRLSDSVKSDRIMTERFCLVTHPDLANEIQENISEYKKISDFITYNPESTTFQRIASAMSDQKMTYKIVFASTSPELIRQAVLNKKGAALLPESFISEDIRNKVLQRLDGVDFERPISLVTRSDTQLSGAHDDLITAIRNTA